MRKVEIDDHVVGISPQKRRELGLWMHYACSQLINKAAYSGRRKAAHNRSQDAVKQGRQLLLYNLVVDIKAQ